MDLALRASEFAGYRPRDLLAEGGSAAVYRAEGPHGIAALKVFRRPLPPESLALAQVLLEIDHPHVARFFAFGQGAVHWAAMEFLEGPSLEEVLAGGRLPVDRALRLAARIAEGMEVLHRAGWVHRDLKPGNVIVLPDDHPKIVDFGLARRVGTQAATPSFEGSWGYAAPEQIEGRAADVRSDVYALGVILYRMLVGRLPFGDAPVAAALGHLHDRPPPPRDQNPAIPPAVEAVLLRALAKDPAARFPTIEAFRAALEACRVEEGQGRRPRRRAWIPVVGIAAALALVAVGLAC